MMPNVLELARLCVTWAHPENGVALDGTTGNGHDTLFLAHQVGANGRVVGFDIQAAAIEGTRKRLEQAGVSGRVTLFHADHARIHELLPTGTVLRAAMFNLGYLPSGDKSVITRSESTISALATTLALLDTGGVLTVVLYPGHPGGEDEARAVLEWSRALPRERAEVAWYQPWNARSPSPSLVAFGKRRV